MPFWKIKQMKRPKMKLIKLKKQKKLRIERYFFETNKYIYKFKNLKKIISFTKNIFGGKITLMLLKIKVIY